MINRNRNILNIISHDRGLLALFGGMLIAIAIVISLAVTAGIWYL